MFHYQGANIPQPRRVAYADDLSGLEPDPLPTVEERAMQDQSLFPLKRKTRLQLCVVTARRVAYAVRV